MNAVVTNYTYGDQWGNLTQVVQDPGTGHLNRTTSMVYDAGGRVTQSTDPMAQMSQFSYNNLGQPTSASFPATANTPAETVSYSYGANGRMGTVTDNRGTTTLAYEANNDRVSSVTDPVTGAVSYTYGLAGERATMSLPGGGTWNYTYETGADINTILPKDDPNATARKLLKITDDQNRIVNYQMDLRGKLRETYSNNVYDGMGSLQSYTWTANYDDTPSGSFTHGWLKTIKNVWYHLVGGSFVGTTLTQNDYTYSTAGMRLTNQVQMQGWATRTETYGYDELYRLTSVNYGDTHTQSYTFDAMGNRATKVNDGVTENYTYNNANMLLTRGTNNYTNDLDGNTLTGGGRTNSWDSQNRLTQCVYSGTTSNFTYGADGARHRSVSGGVTTDYVFDGPACLGEKAGSSLAVSYQYGPRGSEYRRDNQTGSIRWYCLDGHGCVLAEVDPAGNITASQSYDAYGAVRTSAGIESSAEAYAGALGHRSEALTGLIFMRARYLDPVVGRFASEDPSGDDDNWYAYCDSNPVCSVDRSGRSGEPDIDLGGGWGIRIDGAAGDLEADMHIWFRGKEIGSIWNSGTWKHLYSDLSRTKAKDLVARLRGFGNRRIGGWAKVLGRAGFYFACTSVGAYMMQNPLDFIAIMFDIMGDDHTAAQIDRLNNL